MVRMKVMIKYRLLPTRAQHRALAAILESQRQLYNAALEERIDCYRKTGKTLTYIDQCKALTDWRQSDNDGGALPLKVQRWTLKRLDDAYTAFFRRLKNSGSKAGFPRFRGEGWWKSFGFREFIGIRLDGKRLRFNGLPGALRLHLHRPLPAGKPLACVFTRDAKGWSICFQMSVESAEKDAVCSSVGIDLGLNVFAYQSDGAIIPNPRIARKAERKMRIRSRALARCKGGSSRRKKVKAQFARLHAKIVNTRTTWLHQQSARIANSYDLIAVEDLKVSGMVRNSKLARSISDASWSRFISMLSYKAERAGSTLVKVNPRNTSQRCSGCSELVPKSLAVRTHSCPSCGLEIDRDHNASLNILQAVVGLGAANVTHQGERRLGNIAHPGEALP